MSEERSEKTRGHTPKITALGAGLGIIFGAALGSAAIGLVLGAAAGMAIGKTGERVY